MSALKDKAAAFIGSKYRADVLRVKAAFDAGGIAHADELCREIQAANNLRVWESLAFAESCRRCIAGHDFAPYGAQQ